MTSSVPLPAFCIQRKRLCNTQRLGFRHPLNPSYQGKADGPPTFQRTLRYERKALRDLVANSKLRSRSSPLVTQTTTKQRAFGAHVPM